MRSSVRRCINCGDLFPIKPEETTWFLKHQADIQYIKEKKTSIIRIESHCPYCREVIFGMPDDSWLLGVKNKKEELQDKFHEIRLT